MSAEADVAIIGGGFYGCRIALVLAGLGIERIVLLEREQGLMRRASFVNQARVHNGYHYPRAPQTAAGSRANFRRFVEEHRYAVHENVRMVYAIARESRVSADQFIRFCDDIRAPWKPAAHAQARLFDPSLVEGAFEVEEFAFDAGLIARDIAGRLARAGVVCRFGVSARFERASNRDVVLATSDGPLVARHVINCAYASLDSVGIRISCSIKKELAEIALVRPPHDLDGMAVTVVDGPFFSSIPFPALGCYSLTHARYTPHCAWFEPDEGTAPTETRAEMMRRDAARFMPCFESAEHVGSLFEVKAILTREEQSDARPIVFETNPDSERVVSILGSKLDNVYDIEGLVRRHDWSLS